MPNELCVPLGQVSKPPKVVEQYVLKSDKVAKKFDAHLKAGLHSCVGLASFIQNYDQFLVRLIEEVTPTF